MMEKLVIKPYFGDTWLLFIHTMKKVMVPLLSNY